MDLTTAPARIDVSWNALRPYSRVVICDCSGLHMSPQASSRSCLPFCWYSEAKGERRRRRFARRFLFHFGLGMTRRVRLKVRLRVRVRIWLLRKKLMLHICVSYSHVRFALHSLRFYYRCFHGDLSRVSKYLDVCLLPSSWWVPCHPSSSTRTSCASPIRSMTREARLRAGSIAQNLFCKRFSSEW